MSEDTETDGPSVFTLYAGKISMRNIDRLGSYPRHKMFRHFLPLTILSVFFFGNAARAAPPPYDGDMRNNCSPSGVCDSRSIDKIFATPGIVLPTHGFVMATGSFISPAGYWTIVDFDHDTVTSIVTMFDQPTRTTTVTKKLSVKVSAEAAVSVDGLASDLWNSKAKSTSSNNFCTDVAQEFILFDGIRAVWYRGSCPPNGISGDMNKWAERQLQNLPKP
jgi:hypothetical protein